MNEETQTERRRLTPRAVRRLRIASAASLVGLVAAGGATALWLSTRTPEPRPEPSSAARPPAAPLVRLDATPPPPERFDRSEQRDSEAREERRGRGDDAGGERSGGESSSGSEMRRELAALAAENELLEAALSGDMGPGRGSGEIVAPVGGRISARYGRPWGVVHNGIDIRVRAGTSVHAADAGRVVVSDRVGGYGNTVCIHHTGRLSTCYAHNSRLRVSEGESVDSGDVIAKSGCSGDCYGPHLHFEVRDGGEAVNPKDYLGPIRGGRIFGRLP